MGRTDRRDSAEIGGDAGYFPANGSRLPSLAVTSMQFVHSAQCLPPQKTFHLSYGVLIEATGFRRMGRRQNAPPLRSRKL